jgi:hypothetical protein
MMTMVHTVLIAQMIWKKSWSGTAETVRMCDLRIVSLVKVVERSDA